MSSWVKIPQRDHSYIRSSAAMKKALAELAAKIAAEANSAAGITVDDENGYRSESPLEPNPDVKVAYGRARAHVWPSGAAVGEENRNAYLMGIAARDGGNK